MSNYRIVGGTGSASTSFTQLGTGAISRSMEGKLREVVVTPMDFGASGMGLGHDDTTAVQNAVNAVAASVTSGVPGSGHLHFPVPPGGYYLISAGIQLVGLSNLLITAAAGVEIRFSPLASDQPYVSWPDFGKDSLLRLVDCSNIIIDGITLNGNVSNRTASITGTISSASNANPVVITTVAAPLSGALYISGFTGAWAALNGIQTGTKISATTFSLAIDSSTFGAVTGSPVWLTAESENSCLLLAGCSNITIQNTFINGGITDGICLVPDSTGVINSQIRIEDNIIQNCRRNNISGVGQNILWIVRNSISGAGSINGISPMSGIDIEPDGTTQNSFNVHIMDNDIYQNSGNYAVSCVGTGGLVLSGNQIHDNSGYGANFEAQGTGTPYTNGNATLSGGAIFNNGSIGVRIIQRNLVSVTGVEFRFNAYAIQCYLSDGLIIDGCMFDSHINGAINAGTIGAGYDTSLGFINLTIQGCQFRDNFSSAGVTNGAFGWSLAAAPFSGSSILKFDNNLIYGTQNPVTSTSPQTCVLSAPCLARGTGNVAFLTANPTNQFGIQGDGNWNFDLQGVYATGTVAGTNGLDTLVGTGTAWTSVMVGADLFTDGNEYTITAVADATHLTITPAFSATTASGLDYLISGFGTLQQYAGGNPPLKLTTNNGGALAWAAGYLQQTIPDFMGDHISVRLFGAKGDGVTDDTKSLQAAINYAGSPATNVNRTALYIPPGIYLHTGLQITQSGVGVYGSSPLGYGTSALVYNGTGSALTIGYPGYTSGSPFTFGITLENLVIQLSSGVSFASCGITCLGLSESNWRGITVQSDGSGSSFTQMVKFVDTGLLQIDRLTLIQGSYISGTTGILFDQTVSSGNTDIYVENFTFTNIQFTVVLKSLVRGGFTFGYTENCDYDIVIDNTTAWSSNSGMNSVEFNQVAFSKSGSGPTNKKICQVNSSSSSGTPLTMRNLIFDSCSFYLAGGVANPIDVNVTAFAPGSELGITMLNCEVEGCVGSIVQSNSVLARLTFDGNVCGDNSGTGARPPDYSGTATILASSQPLDVNQFPYLWNDPTGAMVLAGSSSGSMLRPPAGYIGRGVIAGVSAQGDPYNDDGFLRLSAGGGIPVPPLTYNTIISATTTNPIVITVSAAPTTGTYVEVTGFSLSGGWSVCNGTWSVTQISGTTFSIPVNSSSFTGAIGVPVWRLCQGSTPFQTTYIDLTGFSGVSDMNRQIVFFVGGSEVFRLNGSSITFSNVPVVVGPLSGGGTQVVQVLNSGQLQEITYGNLWSALAPFLTSSQIDSALGFTPARSGSNSSFTLVSPPTGGTVTGTITQT